jgi:hypothetical protein
VDTRLRLFSLCQPVPVSLNLYLSHQYALSVFFKPLVCRESGEEASDMWRKRAAARTLLSENPMRFPRAVLTLDRKNGIARNSKSRASQPTAPPSGQIGPRKTPPLLNGPCSELQALRCGSGGAALSRGKLVWRPGFSRFAQNHSS